MAILLPLLARAAFAAGPATDSIRQLEFFETKVRPILATTCQKCHGASSQKGGLRLDSREALLKGGESGPVIVPGKPEASPMIDAINYRGLEMPPSGKLRDREITALVEWVKIGAPWPKQTAAPATSRGGEFTISDQDRSYWAFRPLGNPRPPKVRRSAWVANPIDAFVLARLESQGLEPNPPADPRTLLRRVSFDLIGLPPTQAEIDAFVADHSQAAYSRMLDDFLSRPQYGERWGRHWLDVARYAQTNGFERDGEKLEAWRYRDYVIHAFNEDKPYDRFVLEQLAGDELDDVTRESIIATGLYRLGIWDDEPDDRQAAVWDEIDEMVRTTGSAFLGLTLGCARCHNHMFDPISQDDYYRFAAFFRNVEPYGTPISSTHFRANDEGIFTPLAPESQIKEWKSRNGELTRKIEKGRRELAALRKTGKKSEQTEAQRTTRRRLQAELQRLEKSEPAVPFERALSVRDCRPPFKETHVLIRGNAAVAGKKVDPRLPTVFGKSPEAIPVSFHTARFHATGPVGDPPKFSLRPGLGLRRELAKWIADATNPLTPRVMMNRLWQEHFGRGIVRSADNFGRAGTPPTHPELLAWLARDFVDGGWRLKRMHKRILLSNAYQMSSSTLNSPARAADADNELFWRQNLRRLDAESIRDAVLAVSGRLNLSMGGRGIFPKLSEEVLATQSRPGVGWGKSSASDESRRSVYIYLKRTLMVPLLESFDYTNTAESVGSRPVTTVAPQALLLLNSDFTTEQAAAIADRVRREAGAEPIRQIDRLFRLALGRAPQRNEAAIAARLLNSQANRTGVRKGADPLSSLCLVVLNLNEFIYVD